MRSSRIFHTTWGKGASRQKFAHSFHLEKKIPFPRGKISNPPPPSPLSPVPPNTQFLFSQQVSQSLWTGKGILKNSTGVELSLWIGIGKAPTFREIYKLDEIAYLENSPSKLAEKNTLLNLSNSCFFCFYFSISVFCQGHWQLTGQQGKGGDIYLQLCMWDNYHIFLIASLVFTRLLLDEIYHLIQLPFSLIDDVTLSVCLFTWWFDSTFFVIAIWAGKPVDWNSHWLLPLYCKWTD